MKKQADKKGGLKQLLVSGAGSVLLVLLQMVVQNKFGIGPGSTLADPVPGTPVAPVTVVVVAPPVSGDKAGHEPASARVTRNDQATVHSYLIPLNR